MAKELGLDRSVVFRAGTRLAVAGVLAFHDGALRLQMNPVFWHPDILAAVKALSE